MSNLVPQLNPLMRRIALAYRVKVFELVHDDVWSQNSGNLATPSIFVDTPTQQHYAKEEINIYI